MKKQNKVELLAPAGSKDSFYAAIAYGANAVYLGVEAFNARMGAENISLEELPEFVHFAHRRNVKVYITLNTLIRDDEWTQLEETVEMLVQAKVDAVILQDLGVLTFIQEAYPDLECHASTQFSVYDAAGVQRAKELGFSRVVIARETPIEEIEKCAMIDGIELEVFVHGALCVSASGQCLFSATRGGRSGNRGRCAQPCRLNYSCTEAGERKAPWLSLKDLCGIDEVDRLIEAGVHSLKIEGRSKRPAYVAGVIRSYREAIDLEDANLRKRKDEMMRLYYRGFTKGLLNLEPITEIGSLGQPNHQGIMIGTIDRYAQGKATVRSSHELTQGDGIRYLDPEQNWIGQNVSWVKQVGADRYVVRLKKEPIIGSALHLTKDHKMEKAFDWSKIPIQPWIEINGHCVIKVGEKLHLVVTMAGNEYHWESQTLIEPAQTRGSREDEVKKHLMKLGNTPFYWGNLTLDLNGQAYVPARLVNEIRRQMETDLWAAIEAKAQVRQPAELPVARAEKGPVTFTLALYQAGIGEGIDLTLFDRIWILPELESEPWVAQARAAGVEIGWTSLYGQKYPEWDGVKEFNDWNQRERNQEYSGISLFPMNRWSVHRLQVLGVKQIHLSPELSMEQMKNLIAESAGIFEVMGYGRIPLMSMRHCPMKTMGICKGLNCQSCERVYHLEDQSAREYPVVRKGEFAYLLSDQPLVHLSEIRKFERMGVSHMRIQFWDRNEPIAAVQKWIKGVKNQEWNSEAEMNAWLEQHGIKGDQRLIRRGVL